MTRHTNHKRNIRLSSWTTESSCMLAEQDNAGKLGWFAPRSIDKVESDLGGYRAPEATT